MKVRKRKYLLPSERDRVTYICWKNSGEIKEIHQTFDKEGAVIVSKEFHENDGRFKRAEHHIHWGNGEMESLFLGFNRRPKKIEIHDSDGKFRRWQLCSCYNGIEFGETRYQFFGRDGKPEEMKFYGINGEELKAQYYFHWNGEELCYHIKNNRQFEKIEFRGSNGESAEMEFWNDGKIKRTYYRFFSHQKLKGTEYYFYQSGGPEEIRCYFFHIGRRRLEDVKFFSNNGEFKREERYLYWNNGEIKEIYYYRDDGELEREEFFGSDGGLEREEFFGSDERFKEERRYFYWDNKKIKEVHYYGCSRKLEKVHLFKSNGDLEEVRFHCYGDDGECTEIKCCKSDGETLKYIVHYDGRRNISKVVFYRNEKERTFSFDDKNEFGSCFNINLGDDASTHAIIPLGDSKAIRIDIMDRKRGAHTLIVVHQRGVFALVDSNGCNSNNLGDYFTFPKLTLEKYRKLLGLEPGNKLVFLEHEVQNGGTCLICLYFHNHLLKACLKKNFSLEEIVGCYNKVLELAKEGFVLGVKQKRFKILAKQYNLELIKIIADLLRQGSHTGFLKEELESGCSDILRYLPEKKTAEQEGKTSSGSTALTQEQYPLPQPKQSKSVCCQPAA